MTVATGSRREARREERRKQFLQVARALFLDRGYEATTIEEVSSRAGYSKRTVYLYFETKHELFCAVLHPELLALRERLGRSPCADSNGREQLIATAHEYVSFSRQQPELFSLLMWFESNDFYRGRDRSGLPEHAAACLEVNEQMSRRVDLLIEQGLADGSIESDHTPAQLNLMFWAGAVGLLRVCAQRADILEAHYQITEHDLLDGFIRRFLPDTRESHGAHP